MKQINVVFKCNPNCWESDCLSELFGLCNFKIQNRDFVGEWKSLIGGTLIKMI
jgi:hypothetical protein